MKVGISYADGFPLTGWAKETFNKRVLNAFGNGFFDACDLDACRSVLGLKEVGANPDLRAELHSWHCTYFRDMPDIVRAELPTKVSEYLGEKVSIRYTEKPSFPSGWARVAQPRFLVPLCLLTTLAVASCVALLLLPEKKVPVYPLGTILPAPTLRPDESHDVNAASSRASVQEDPDPILDTQSRTQSPRATLQGLSTALMGISESAGAAVYDVRVIVTPVPQHKLPSALQLPSVDSNRSLPSAETS